jgi:CelD/BcsL family acetyltransferase involved in cellulose biosynthesis
LLKNIEKKFVLKDMEVEVIDQLTKLPSLKDEWDRVNQGAVDSSPFSSYAWITTWAECYLGRNELRIVIVRRDGKLVGVAPFYLTSKFGIRILRLLGLKEVNGECVNFLIEPGLEEDVGYAIFDALLNSVGHWDAVSFWAIRSNSMLQHLLFSQGSQLLNETQVITSMLGPARIIRFNSSWEDFLKNRSQNFRKHTKRYLSACEEYGITITFESEMKSHDDIVDRLISVESRSWQGITGRSVIRTNKKFLEIIFPKLLECAEADIVWAYKDGTPLAFLFFLICGNHAFFYITGYDSSIGNLSLGNVVHAFALRHLCEQGIRIIDFMTDAYISSDSHYKERWTGEYLISLRHFFAKKSLPVQLVGAVRYLLIKH